MPRQHPRLAREIREHRLRDLLRAMRIAAEICIYTNTNLTLEELAS